MKTHLNLLFIEDSPIDAELALLELERGGFDVSWKRVDTEETLRRSLAESTPQIVLSDYSMPSFNGMVALNIVQEIAPHIPFIFISGTIGEERAIGSIREGATDYVLKDNLRRLATAVRRALAEADQRIAANAAREVTERLAAILEATSDCVAINLPDGRLIYMNTSGRALTGFGNGDISTRNFIDIHPLNARGLIADEAWPLAKANGVWHGEMEMLGPNGSLIPMSQVIIAHTRPDGEVKFYSTIARDIREQKAYEARITYLAHYDALTDLPNRSLLSDRVAQASAHQQHRDRPIGLLVADIDQFKIINDGLGQAAGDELLRKVGERLVTAVRDGDTVARLGADEFAVLVVDLAHPDDMLAIWRKIQEAVHRPFDIKDHEVHLTMSIGASACPRDGTNFEDLLRCAEVAMHRVKAIGTDRFQFYSENMTNEATDRVELENALRVALDRREVILYYQPQFHLDSREIVGVEALMRWHHLERGWIPPGVFIPIAEHSDLIHSLGKWALTEACTQLKRWEAIAPRLQMAVNASARQFRNASFWNSIAGAIRDSGVDPARLEIELTESVLIDTEGEAQRILGEIKCSGAKIAIDDFGTGYSSLSYLSQLPIDCLKIDRAFLQRIPGQNHDTAIVQAIISLAESMSLEVVAEGIETEAQIRFLRERGCAVGQGFYFAKPVPADEIDILLRGSTAS